MEIQIVDPVSHQTINYDSPSGESNMLQNLIYTYLGHKLIFTCPATHSPSGTPANRSAALRLLPTSRDYLGTQTIEGFAAEGMRSKQTIRAGAIGNERPIDIITERWYSPELQVVLMSRTSDPRTGETTSRLSNIRREEPAMEKVRAPKEYLVKF